MCVGVIIFYTYMLKVGSNLEKFTSHFIILISSRSVDEGQDLHSSCKKYKTVLRKFEFQLKQLTSIIIVQSITSKIITLNE